MTSRSEASAFGAWKNAVKRFAELSGLSVPSGTRPKQVFEELAAQVLGERQELRAEVERLQLIAEDYENKLAKAKDRVSRLRGELRGLRQGNTALQAVIDELRGEIDSLKEDKRRLRYAPSSPRAPSPANVPLF